MNCSRLMARSSVRMKTMLGCLAELAEAVGGVIATGDGAVVTVAVPADPLGCPKLAFCALQAATICGSICGRGLLALCGWAVPCMIGAMQSFQSPLPPLTPPCTKPAFTQAAFICSQGPWAAAAGE